MYCYNQNKETTYFVSILLFYNIFIILLTIQILVKFFNFHVNILSPSANKDTLKQPKTFVTRLGDKRKQLSCKNALASDTNWWLQYDCIHVTRWKASTTSSITTRSSPPSSSTRTSWMLWKISWRRGTSCCIIPKLTLSLQIRVPHIPCIRYVGVSSRINILYLYTCRSAT